MNLWKLSTVTLAAGFALVCGRDAFTSARAATGNEGTTGIAYDWAQEQPHMDRALNDLKGARHSLEVAAEHKGGWRVLALKHCDEAIAETVRGMEYAKNHPHD